ncbi:recombinase family protein [Streptomyces sviceus]|uniref:recombinase family protein n=1 Tax=Streptomyces sviceus TaxID=285530 RepID=UPI003678FEDD
MIEGGRTLTDLAEELNRRGILTRSGRRWTRANLHRRLKSAAFLGEAVFRRSDQQWGGHCTRLDGSGRPLYGESVVIPLPPILAADRIRAFQQALAELARPRRMPLGEYPLTGRIYGPCKRPTSGASAVTTGCGRTAVPDGRKTSPAVASSCVLITSRNRWHATSMPCWHPCSGAGRTAVPGPAQSCRCSCSAAA